MTIEDVKKLTVEPDDVLVIFLPEDIIMDDNIINACGEMGRKLKCTILPLPHGTKIEKLKIDKDNILYKQIQSYQETIEVLQDPEAMAAINEHKKKKNKYENTYSIEEARKKIEED